MTPGVPSVPVTRYDLANRCFALKSVAANAHAVHATDGSYAATAPAVADGEPLYLKPTALGKYICYATDKTMLAANGSNVGSVSSPSDAADWTIETTGSGQYTLFSKSANKSLATDASGKLVLSDAPGTFKFAPTTGCTPYPEMPVDIDGETYKGSGVNKPVIGFADGHTHMMMSSELSDGSRNVGPSAGGVLYGMPFNRFGVGEALKNCEAVHGPNGLLDPDTIIHTAPTPHETPGWPTFIGWPTADSNTHQGMYYKWVERAWKAGLRVQVDLGTNINALCELGAAFIGATHPGTPIPDCNDMSIGTKQVQYMYEIRDYVDAQEGGPGKGWYQPVKSPAEARKVINEGKLAVVPGVEFADLFDCTVNFVGPIESIGCTKEDIDTKLDELYALGVRQIYPFHDVNSALGGTGIFNGLAINLIGFLQTQAFWKTYNCPRGGEGPTYFYNAGAEMTTAIPGTGSDPLTQAVFAAGGGVLPVYPAGRQCNSRGITELGRYAIEQIMKKKMVIDIDHAELSIKQDIIDIAKAQKPQYPLVSMHGGHGGISQEQAIDVLKLGGVIYPYAPNGKGAAEFIQKIKPIWPAGRPLAMGYGFDGNGFGGYAGPRGAGSKGDIVYPFTLFKGPGWGPQFAAAGIKPITVNKLTIPESGKSWNPDEVGTAHYGLIADYVEQTRIEGGQEAIDALYNSAEAYLQMWEKVVNR
ncbi:peptidase M19 [Stenotrophobium rhamnosiphilum]|uniref:Peptidase M19 n=1 Tax=Stenotrophobium rhamnosiphilum TaxID=2029166 RepID=A0A2T5MG08_9GAMM|nr:peptidase M19 [Stenotrophobium rhamnosiphilum]